MRRLLHAELLKATTTRLLFWFALTVTALALLLLSLHIAQLDAYRLAQTGEQRSIVQFAGVAVLLSLVIGIILMAGEYGHGTITHTFVGSPRRVAVVGAKLIAAATVSFLFALFTVVVTVAVTALWLKAEGVSFGLGRHAVLTTLGGVLVASALAGALGVGLGAIFRRQTPAIVISLIWLLVGENILASLGNDARFLPGHAFAAVVAARGATTDVPAFGTGTLVALGYAALAAVLGVLLVERTDVG